VGYCRWLIVGFLVIAGAGFLGSALAGAGFLGSTLAGGAFFAGLGGSGCFLWGFCGAGVTFLLPYGVVTVRGGVGFRAGAASFAA